MSSDGVWSPPPQMVEIHIYEDRNFGHRVIVKRGKLTRDLTVKREERAHLSDEETMHAVRYLLEQVRLQEAQCP